MPLPQDGGATFSLLNRLIRAAWNIAWFLLCSWTPPICWKWRRWVLVFFGAELHRECDVRGSARIWLPRNLKMGQRALIAEGVICYNVAQVHLHDYAIVSQRSHLCTATHDIRSADFPLVSKEIIIEKKAWVAAEAFVGPGVRIGEFAVLGARACAFTDIPLGEVHRGNPAVKYNVRNCMNL